MTRITEHDTSGTPVRIGILGAGGQLGRSLVREVDASNGAERAFAATRDDVDLCNVEAFDGWLDRTLDRPGTPSLDVVINAAAHTKVDACESEAELAYRVNALGPGAWARMLAERGVRFLHLSTDYVFSGNAERPYREDDPTEPRTVYGRTKRAGEIAVLGSHPRALVVRTSWVFGPGRNFVVAILEQAEARRQGRADGPLRVVDDQVGAPTFSGDLASALVDLCVRPDRKLRELSGLLHLRNAGETSWFGFAERILATAGYADIPIEPVPSAAFETAAPRPAYSVLDCSRAAGLGVTLRPWADALASYLRDGGPRSATESSGEGSGSNVPNASGASAKVQGVESEQVEKASMLPTPACSASAPSLSARGVQR